MRSRDAASATDASARSSGRSAYRSLARRTRRSEPPSGTSRRTPPRSTQRRKSRAASFLTRRARSAHTSVRTGHVPTSFVPGCASSQRRTVSCQRSRASNRAISGPLSTITRAGTERGDITSPSGRRPGIRAMPGVRGDIRVDRAPVLREIARPLVTSEQILAELKGGTLEVGIRLEPRGQGFPDHGAGRQSQRDATLSYRSFLFRVELDRHRHAGPGVRRESSLFYDVITGREATFIGARDGPSR